MLPRPPVTYNPDSGFPEDWIGFVQFLQLMPTTQGVFDPHTLLPVANPPPNKTYTAYVLVDAQLNLVGQFVSTVGGSDTWRWTPGGFRAAFGFLPKPLGHDTDLSGNSVDTTLSEQAFAPMQAAVTPVGYTNLYQIRHSGGVIGWMWVTSNPTVMHWVVATAELTAQQRLPKQGYVFEPPSFPFPGQIGGPGFSKCQNT